MLARRIFPLQQSGRVSAQRAANAWSWPRPADSRVEALPVFSVSSAAALPRLPARPPVVGTRLEGSPAAPVFLRALLCSPPPPHPQGKRRWVRCHLGERRETQKPGMVGDSSLTLHMAPCQRQYFTSKRELSISSRRSETNRLVNTATSPLPAR